MIPRFELLALGDLHKKHGARTASLAFERGALALAVYEPSGLVA